MEENSDAYPTDPRLLNFEKIYLIGQVLLDVRFQNVFYFMFAFRSFILSCVTKKY